VRIVLSGMVAGSPHQGGASWAVLQYVLGLRELGHDVMLIEPVRHTDARAVAYFRRHIVQRFGLEDRAAMLVAGTERTVGVPYGELARFAGASELLLNISGMLRDGALRTGGTQVYVDLDPAFNQLWDAEGVDAGLDGHDRYVTVGGAIGTPECPVPTRGRRWIPTLPPVVISLWPLATRLRHDALTTIGNWRSYGSIDHDGIRYGQKAHSLRRLIGLPRHTSRRLLLAYAIDPAERADLIEISRHGWELTDPATSAGTPDAYARFVTGSWAEIGIAKSGYVVSSCGWFSDRSACYLASGRPVLAQETGFSRFLPTGEGLLAFSTVEQAAAAIDRLSADPERHSRAARDMAEDLLDSRVVLGRLLERVGGSA
jgi:hypothetical protein